MKVPRIFQNPISWAGMAIAVVALFLFFFLFLLDTLGAHPNSPYVSLLLFVGIPSLMFGGFGLVLLGGWWTRRRFRKTGEYWVDRMPKLDLNLPRHRRVIGSLLLGGVTFLFLSAFGSYHAYEATESVSFCGQVCHTVMEPEHTALLASPHARIRCVDCHVGPGAEHLIRAKISGMHQLYGVLTDSYPRPIPVPVANLRPAQIACETCHWRDNHRGSKRYNHSYFLGDEENTRWDLDLVVNIGNRDRNNYVPEAPPWHLSEDYDVEYLTHEPNRQEIPFVRVRNLRTGEVKEFVADGEELTDEIRQDPAWRVMDCLDCHNRPSHQYFPPGREVNNALSRGLMDPTLPSLKATAVELLNGDYDDVPGALAAIESGLRTFYEENHPEVAREKSAAIERSIAEAQRIYRRNFFPLMKVRWDAYPDNSGHLMFPGCFRCHGGQHRSADGEVISRDCKLCHQITSQGPHENRRHDTTEDGMDFEHPVDIDGAWETDACTDCHTGAP